MSIKKSSKKYVLTVCVVIIALNNSSYKYCISGCELMYLPYPKDDGYLLTPAWVFIEETQVPEGSGYASYYDDIFVNAVTGMIYE